MQETLNGTEQAGAQREAKAVLRVALYYRVSGLGQVRDGYGLDAQRRQLPEHAERQGWQVVGEYEDAGISGESIVGRPGMLRLLADLQAGKFDLVMAIEASRLSRGSMAEWEDIKDLCDRHSVALMTPGRTLYRPEDEEADFTSDIDAVLSKREKKMIVRRLRRGKMEAAQQGRITSGQAPFGYTFERYGRKASEKRLVIDDGRAATVRTNFSLVAGGKFSTRGMALHLSDTLQIPGPAGGRWYPGRIASIVRDRSYLGEWGWLKSYAVAADPKRQRKPDCRRNSKRVRDPGEWIPLTCPPIIEEALWQGANTALDRRAEHGRGRPARKHPRGLLASFLRCPHCSLAFLHQMSHMSAAGVPTRSYVCQGRRQYKVRGTDPCVNPRWRAEELEEAVWARLAQAIKSPEMLRDMAEAADAELPEDPGVDVAATARALEKNEQAAERVREALREGVYTVEETRVELGKVRQERQALEAQLAAVQDQVQAREAWEQALLTLGERCERWRAAVDHLDAEGKRETLEDLVEWISLDQDGHFRIKPFVGGPYEGRIGSGRIGSEMNCASSDAVHKAAARGLVLSGTVRRAA